MGSCGGLSANWDWRLARCEMQLPKAREGSNVAQGLFDSFDQVVRGQPLSARSKPTDKQARLGVTPRHCLSLPFMEEPELAPQRSPIMSIRGPGCSCRPAAGGWGGLLGLLGLLSRLLFWESHGLAWACVGLRGLQSFALFGPCHRRPRHATPQAGGGWTAAGLRFVPPWFLKGHDGYTQAPAREFICPRIPISASWEAALFRGAVG